MCGAEGLGLCKLPRRSPSISVGERLAGRTPKGFLPDPPSGFFGGCGPRTPAFHAIGNVSAPAARSAPADMPYRSRSPSVPHPSQRRKGARTMPPHSSPRLSNAKAPEGISRTVETTFLKSSKNMQAPAAARPVPALAPSGLRAGSLDPRSAVRGRIAGMRSEIARAQRARPAFRSAGEIIRGRESEMEKRNDVRTAPVPSRLDRLTDEEKVLGLKFGAVLCVLFTIAGILS